MSQYFHELNIHLGTFFSMEQKYTHKFVNEKIKNLEMGNKELRSKK